MLTCGPQHRDRDIAGATREDDAASAGAADQTRTFVAEGIAASIAAGASVGALIGALDPILCIKTYNLSWCLF